ncbi:MAG: hypothetical protein QXK37_03615 [Candidatus Woesearchaeota archaeon]
MIFAGCTNEAKREETNVQKSPVQDIEAAATKEYKSGSVKVTKNGSVFDIYVQYPTTEFQFKNEESDKNRFLVQNYNRIDRLSKVKHKLGQITVSGVMTSGKMAANPSGQLHIISQNNSSVTREVATISISMDELTRLKNTYDDPQNKMEDYVRYHPFFLTELKLRTNKAGINNMMVSEGFDNQTNKTFSEIFYEPTNSMTFGDTKDDKKKFEDDFADIIRYSFESNPEIGRIRVVAQANKVDNRSYPTDTIATYEITREKFESIMNNWDDFRFTIYKEINYTPIFLLDLVSTSQIESMNHNKTVTINATLQGWTSIENSIKTVQEDAVKIIYEILHYDKNIDSIYIQFTGVIPVEESATYLSDTSIELTKDKTHQIIRKFFTVKASRDKAMSVNTEKLTPEQIIYNFEWYWDPRVEMYNLVSNMGIKKQNIREIKYIGDKSLSVSVDVCQFTDSSGKAKRESVNRSITTIANNTIFKVHPPYLEAIHFEVKKIILDQLGQEEVSDVGSVIFEKDPLTKYWFQTVEAPEWIKQKKITISLNENLTYCQRR